MISRVLSKVPKSVMQDPTVGIPSGMRVLAAHRLPATASSVELRQHSQNYCLQKSEGILPKNNNPGLLSLLGLDKINLTVLKVNLRLWWNGCKVEGCLAQGEPNGQGKQTVSHGAIITGDIKDGDLNGQGKMTWPNGSSKEGEFKEGKLNGRGKKTFSDGMVFEGEFKNDKLNGRGKMMCINGNSIEGEFRDGKLKVGKITYSDGNSIEGEFRDNKLNGQGKVTDSDGNSIEGEFRDGELHGQGKMTWTNGSSMEGEFSDGKLKVGKGKITSSYGNTFEGDFKDGKLNGQGKETLADGTTIEGEFKDGSPVIRENFLASPNKMEKACLNRFYCLLLDKAEGGFQYEVVNTMLRQLLDQHEQLLSYESIEEYVKNGCIKNCTLNVSRDCHGFLLGVKDIGQGQYELSLYDSSGCLGHRTTCIKRSVSREKLFDVLRQLHSKDKLIEFVAEFRKNENLTDIPYDKKQKTQKSENCALDCWFAYLKHNLSDRDFHTAKETLFLSARDFFEAEITNKGTDSAQELEDLRNLANAKYDRRKTKAFKVLMDRICNSGKPVAKSLEGRVCNTFKGVVEKVAQSLIVLFDMTAALFYRCKSCIPS